MTIPINVQSIIVATLLGGGSLIIYFLKGILEQFKALAATVNQHTMQIAVLETRVKMAEDNIGSLQEQVWDLESDGRETQ